MQTTIGAYSDVGMVREENQDGFLLLEPTDPAQRQRIGTLAVVADGMGGMAAGRLANRTALKAFLASMLVRADLPQEEPNELAAAVEAANKAVYDISLANPSWRGMGTTMTAVRIRGNRLDFAHVGDTRLLLVRDNRVALKTKDHVKDGTSELTRGVGVFEQVEVDIGEFDLNEGDRLVMCSDGLWDLVKPAETREIVLAMDPTDAARALVALANQKEGHDNTTAIVIRCGATPSTNSRAALPTVSLRAPLAERKLPALPWLIAAGAGAAMFVAGIAYLLLA